MTDILTVAELITELEKHPAEAKVMLAFVKDPGQFDYSSSWAAHTSVECLPLERGEITIQDGVVHLCAERPDYSEEFTTIDTQVTDD